MIEATRRAARRRLVIVWSVSRWARNQEDHWVARGLVTQAGAKLSRVKEPIGEETSHGILLEGVMAARRCRPADRDSEEVKRGIKRKVEVGGTRPRSDRLPERPRAATAGRRGPHRDHRPGAWPDRRVGV